MSDTTAESPHVTATAPVGAQAFRYLRQDIPEGSQVKYITRLARTDRIIANVQAIKEGGENNLHSHSHLDGFWMILSGRARFYGEGDEVLGEFGKHEGILIPRNFMYWFESIGEDLLELLQVEAFDIVLPTEKSIFGDRKDFTPRTAATTKAKIFEGRTASPDYGRMR